MPMDQLIDKEKEMERIAKELSKVEKDISMLEGKLSNANFVSRAPEAVVQGEKEKLEKAKALYAQLQDSKERLSAL